jgi:hypothetical protein
VVWIAAISLVVAALVWLTLYEIKVVAEDNAPTAAETAQCRADLDPGSEVDPGTVCPSGDDVIWAARHPVRNAVAVFVLGLFAGSLSIYLNRRLQ